LIDFGSTRKYLLYAIGEIALVVIGILIALQINNWNEWRKEREVESIMMQTLRDELTLSKKSFEQRIDQITVLKKASLSIINWIDLYPIVIATEHLMDTLALSQFLGPYSPQRSIIDRIMAGNEFDLISVYSVKSQLNEYHTQLQEVQKIEDMMFEFRKELVEITGQYVRFRDLINDTPSWSSELLKVPAEDVDQRELFSDLSYDNQLSRSLNMHLICINQEEMVIDLLDEILELIDSKYSL